MSKQVALLYTLTSFDCDMSVLIRDIQLVGLTGMARRLVGFVLMMSPSLVKDGGYEFLGV